jgi:hypothetical protein
MLLSMLAPPGAPSPEELIKFYAEKKVMNYAMVQNGVIVNVVDWDGVTPYTQPEGCELHQWDGPMNIGWLWVDGAPVDPNPPPLPEPEMPAVPSEGPTVI